MDYRSYMKQLNIDQAFKKLSKTLIKSSEAICERIEQQNERKKANRELQNNKKFLEGYKNEIPLVRASLSRISIEKAAKEIKEINK